MVQTGMKELQYKSHLWDHLATPTDSYPGGDTLSYIHISYLTLNEKMPLHLNISMTPAGFPKVNEPFLKHRHQPFRFSPFSAEFEINYQTLPYYNSPSSSTRWTSNSSSDSEGSVSSTLSDADSGFSISLSLQDPIGTPRRPGPSYPRGLNRLPAPLSDARGEQQQLRANATDAPPADSNRNGHQRPKYEPVQASRASLRVEDTYHGRVHTADLVEESNEYLPPRFATPHTAIAPSPLEELMPLPRLYAHNVRFRACADDAVRRIHANGLGNKSTAPTATQSHPSSRCYPFPIGDRNPFQPSRQTLLTQGNPVRQPAPMRCEPPAAPRSMVNPHIIKGLERLLEDDDEEIIVYLNSHPAAKEIAAAVAEEDRMIQEQEVRPRKHRPAVLNQRAHDRFLAERRLISPHQTYRHLDEEHGHQRKPEPGLFDDLPVCEMSVAMGLHDPPRRPN
ncbi:hypothetical protein C0995_015619 [Termitomyces sp. Mi166|nr:hypothetical protein C0995_013995 [Termitomyces sp. Mi166\